MSRFEKLIVASFVSVLFLATGYVVQAQISSQPTTPVVVSANPYPLVALSSTAAINTQTTLTIPAPPAGWNNYVCSLHFNATQSGTGALNNLQVTTSTNFNAYAIKFGILAVASQANYDWVENWGITNVGCVKSAAAGTSTTFVSPAAIAQTAFTWTTTYFQAP